MWVAVWADALSSVGVLALRQVRARPDWLIPQKGMPPDCIASNYVKKYTLLPLRPR